MRPIKDPKKDELFDGWLWIAAVLTTLALVLVVAFACDAGAQGSNVVGKRLANGDALLVAGVEEPPDDGFDPIAAVCFREVGGGELGCVTRSSFVSVGNGAFQAGGDLHTIAETLPAGESPNLVAVLVLTKPSAFMALSRSIDNDEGEKAPPDVVERPDPIVFAAFVPPPPPPPADPSPKAPVLILIEALEGALRDAKEQLAQVEP